MMCWKEYGKNMMLFEHDMICMYDNMDTKHR
jgi:hypothetical protein